MGTLEAEAESLVEPGSDGVADIDRVEQEESFEVGGCHLGLESLEPVLAEALDVDPRFEVDYLGANKVFFVSLSGWSQVGPPLRSRHSREWCDYSREGRDAPPDQPGKDAGMETGRERCARFYLRGFSPCEPEISEAGSWT